MRACDADVVDAEAADRVDRQRHLFAHRGEGLPTDPGHARMRSGRQHRAEHGEIATQRLRPQEVFRIVAGRADAAARGFQGCERGVDPGIAQLRGTQVQAGLQPLRKCGIAIDQYFGAGFAA